MLNVFRFRDRLIRDYADFTRSLVECNERIREFVSFSTTLQRCLKTSRELGWCKGWAGPFGDRA